VPEPLPTPPILARVPRLARVAIALAVICLLLGITAVACGSSNDANTNTADATTTEVPVDDGTEAGSVPGSAKPKGTFPKGTLPKGTLKPRPTTTKAPPTTKAPATTKAPPTTRPPTPTTEPLAKKFCEYIATVDLSNISDDNWTEGFNRLYVGVTNAVDVAPPSVKQAVLDLKATVDALRPAVEAGQITSNAQLAAWFVAQTPDTQSRIKAAGKQIQLYTSAQCN
jgi:hypothetical protein